MNASIASRDVCHPAPTTHSTWCRRPFYGPLGRRSLCPSAPPERKPGSPVQKRHDPARPSAEPDHGPAVIARTTVWRALDRLSPRRRSVVVMHELEGLPIAAIASQLGISTITVRWHLSAGRRDLARVLTSRHGGGHEHRP